MTEFHRRIRTNSISETKSNQGDSVEGMSRSLLIFSERRLSVSV